MSEGLLVNALALVVVLGYIARRAYPVTEAVRIRNAFLIDPSVPADFDWTPDNVPASFRREGRAAYPEFAELVRRLVRDSLAGDWEKSLAIAGHLSERAAEDGPIQSDLVTTYRRIREGHGYCADFVRVFLALAHAAGVFARQWAFSFDGFGSHGHTFVEVYDRARGKWLAIDVHNNFHFVDASSGEPLGALEVRDALAGEGRRVEMRANGPGRAGYVEPQKALAYYRRGLNEWYLWWGNAVFSGEARLLVVLARGASRRLAHVVGHVTGAQPRIRILETPENAPQRRRMVALKTRIGWTAALAALLGGGLIVQLLMPSGAPKVR